MSYLEELSFGHVVRLNDFILEVIPHQGVEINDLCVEEYHHFIHEKKQPVGILFNRSYGFSYTFDALQKIIANPHIVAVAFLATERYAYTITENDIGLIIQGHPAVGIIQVTLEARAVPADADGRAPPIEVDQRHRIDRLLHLIPAHFQV